jgi:hypothetical protein
MEILYGAAHYHLCQGSTNPMHIVIMELQADIVVLVFSEMYSRKFSSS